MENSLEDQLLQEFGPTTKNTESRVKVYKFIEKVILSAFPSVRVACYGSFPLKTFLRTGDIDITIIPETLPFPDMQICMLTRLKEEFDKSDSSEMKISEICSVNAQVPLLKLKVDSISADVSVNQLPGIHRVFLFEELSRHFPANLLKRSIMIIKVWASHFGRIQGAMYGGLSSYALEVLVLFILNTQPRLTSPIAVLKSFITFFSTFNWTENIITVHKALSVSEYVSIISRNTQYTPSNTQIPFQFFSSLVFRLGGNPELTLMPLKGISIVDPYDSSNNLARNVSLNNLERFKQVFSISAEIINTNGVFALFQRSRSDPVAQVVVEDARTPLVVVCVGKKENERKGGEINEAIFMGSYKKRQQNFRRNFKALLENTQKGRIKVK